LSEYKAGLVQLAEQLLEKEVIFTEDLEKIFGKRKGSANEPEPEEPAKAKRTRKSSSATEESAA
jgi:cell division protease FtsH